jgi:hypothetical protein
MGFASRDVVAAKFNRNERAAYKKACGLLTAAGFRL